MMPPTSTSSSKVNLCVIGSNNIKDATSGKLMAHAVVLFPCGHTFNEDTVIQRLAGDKLCPLDGKPIEGHAPNHTVRQLAATAKLRPLESSREIYIERLISLLEELQIPENPTLKKMVELGDKIHALSPLSIPSLYGAIAHLHFPDREGDVAEQVRSLDQIYRIESNLSVEEKVSCIFQRLFNLATSYSPMERTSKNSKDFTLSNYSSYLLNISRLWLWGRLPGGKEYLNQAEIKALPLKIKGELLAQWIKEHDEDISCLYLDIPLKILEEPNLDLQLEITILPPEIGQLSQLERLFICHRQLTALSAEIGQLSQLEQLNLSWNQLASLPAEIGQLSQLKKLCLHSNKLTMLPTEIGQLSKLEKLELSNNQLVFLPAEIGQLSKLEQLDLSRNQLVFLPAKIGQLSQLEQLDLSYNKLTVLPTGIGKLSQLKHLDLIDNHLNALPAEIGQLSQLEKLDLIDNHLNALPMEIGQLSQLTRLWLSDNQLTALPAEIGQLHSLTELYLVNNQLATLPSEFGQLDELRLLYLNKNRLTSLPLTIGQLDSLQELYLDSNRLANIPGTIGQLLDLDKLHLSNNRLTSLPNGLGRLSSLRELYLDNNKLTTFPRLLQQLPGHCEVDVRGNPFLENIYKSKIV
ncbi:MULTISPECIES: leucine-rich repeat domain-containing protein [unclassified Neochlamydia]|uniref:leucine-rich repeat domain-containing protein n=1 Tax=unclassified Neochlamydia TaxID=2643326 RepID=UPI001409DA08|nr:MULTISPECIES: leucine-rich repeat domain-containing protein [unclassified Neochlamydia]MBS4169487.1 Uncharacterized protein [Neochlamydia sp. AcF95]NGY95197.1 hypothetical protein [Neochlamydia sp. AcF84]